MRPHRGMDPNNGRYLMVGSRCVYGGGLASLVGKSCVITNVNHRPRSSRDMVLARFDYDGRERVVDIRQLLPEEYAMKNIKTTVLAAVKILLAKQDADSEKEQAVRQLGVAAELVRLGEADKKKAKTELTKLGIITGQPQDGVVFDSPRYVMTATTKAASSRITGDALSAALAAEGLSEAMKRRIVAASTVESKAATSFSVETK
jgi:hypothetical protein